MAVSKANILESMGWLKDLQDAANEEKFVMKEEGKQLSSNDFSDTDKAKLDSLANFEPATATKLGGIKVGNGLDIEDDGTLNIDYDLPTASQTTKGGVKIGEGLTIIGETLTADQYDLPTASTTRKGGIKVGEGLSMNGETLNADSYDLPTASKTRKGGIKVGDGLEMEGETLNCTVEPGITNLVSQTQNGIMRATDKVKLDSIEDNAQVNTIERIKVDNSTLAITNKTVNIDLSGFVKSADISGAYHYKGTINSYTNLPTSGQVAGDVYNIRTAGGQDINGDEIKAGDNVAWTGVGWDVLAGTVDLSNFVEKVPGKDLSTEDFTTALKNKLEGLSNYSLPTASATTKGGVKIGTGLQMNGETLSANVTTDYTLPTASTTTKGGIKIGTGLSMNGETLNAVATSDYTLPTASTSTKGGVKVGNGLSMNGDTLNCTLIGGGTDEDFTGASANFGGASGLVPSPAAGDNTKFLRGDGTWAPATQNVTVYSAAVTVPASPTEFDGALWEDVIDNEPVLKMRYGDYEFNFNYDTKNYTGTTPPPISPEDAQLYMLDTVPSTDEGTLWYNVTQSTYFPIPALCLHAGSFDYGYNYDTITYKGDNTGLYSYLPLQQAIADAMGNTWTSYRSNVRFDTVATGVKGLRNTDTASGLRYGIVHTFSNPLATFTIDFWFTWFSTGLTNTSGNYLHMLNLYGTQANGKTFGYQHASLVGGSPGGGLVLSTGGSLTFSSTTNGVILTKTEIAGHSTRRIHIAIEHEGTKTPTIYLNGQPIARQPTTQIANIREIAIQPYVEKETSTTFLRASCIDHFRIWNKVVWGEAFTPPALSSY